MPDSIFGVDIKKMEESYRKMFAETFPNLIKEFKASGMPREDMEKFIDAFFKSWEVHDGRFTAEFVKSRMETITGYVDSVLEALTKLESSLIGSWEDEDGQIDEIRSLLNGLKENLNL